MTAHPLVVPLSELTDYCRCPRCRRGVGLFLDATLEAFRSDFQCHRRGCDQHWWAMRLHAGAVRPQLAVVVGDAIARDLMLTFKLPDSIAQPMYWQLSLTGHQAYRRIEARRTGQAPEPVPTLGRVRRPA